MAYEDRYKELEALSHSDDAEVKRKAENWLIGIGLQGTAGLKVSEFLLDLAVRNSKGEIDHDEVSHLINKRYPDSPLRDSLGHHPLDGDYEVIPNDSPRIKEIEENARRLRPGLYEQDKTQKGK